MLEGGQNTQREHANSRQKGLSPDLNQEPSDCDATVLTNTIPKSTISWVLWLLHVNTWALRYEAFSIFSQHQLWMQKDTWQDAAMEQFPASQIITVQMCVWNEVLASSILFILIGHLQREIRPLWTFLKWHSSQKRATTYIQGVKLLWRFGHWKLLG